MGESLYEAIQLGLAGIWTQELSDKDFLPDAVLTELLWQLKIWQKTYKVFELCNLTYKLQG